MLSLGWLASCFAAGRLVEPAAADYLQLSAATLQVGKEAFWEALSCKRSLWP